MTTQLENKMFTSIMTTIGLSKVWDFAKSYHTSEQQTQISMVNTIMVYEASLAENTTLTDARVLCVAAMLFFNQEHCLIQKLFSYNQAMTKMLNKYDIAENKLNKLYKKFTGQINIGKKDQLAFILDDVKYFCVYEEYGNKYFTDTYVDEYNMSKSAYSDVSPTQYAKQQLYKYSQKSLNWYTNHAKRKAFKDNYTSNYKRMLEVSQKTLLANLVKEMRPTTNLDLFSLCQIILTDYKGEEDGVFAISGKDNKMINDLLSYCYGGNFNLNIMLAHGLIKDSQALLANTDIRNVNQQFIADSMKITHIFTVKDMEDILRAAAEHLVLLKHI